MLETEKDLRIEAQERDIQNQLIAKQTARQEVSSTLEELQRELEAIRGNQNNQNSMDISSSTDAMAELNCIKRKLKRKNVYLKKD